MGECKATDIKRCCGGSESMLCLYMCTKYDRQGGK